MMATEGTIARLYDALAEGTVKDALLFRDSLARLEAEREECLRLIAGLDRRGAG